MREEFLTTGEKSKRMLDGRLRVSSILAFIILNMTESGKEINDLLGELIGLHEVYQTFFADLKKAVSSEDKNAVTGMVDDPIANPLAERM